jgi:hypothetical protein
MNETLLNIEIDESIMRVVDLAVSASGTVAIFLSIYFNKIKLALATALLTIVSTVRSNMNFENNTEHLLKRILAVDALCSILLTIVISFESKLHNTFIGMFRVLWLILLITSSSSFVTISAFTAQNQIPNIVTIILIGLSLVMILFISIYNKLKKAGKKNSHVNQIISEYALVTGSLLLRFDEQFERYIGVYIGWTIWHLMCWIAVIACATIKKTDHE